MRQRRAPLTLALLPTFVLLLGCSPTAPPTPTAVPACTTADGRRVADVMQQHAREWDDALALAQTSPRVALAGPVGQLQRVRREVEAQQWPACAVRTQSALAGAMTAYIDGFVDFMGDRSGYEAKFDRGAALLNDFRSEAAVMAGQPTPVPVPTVNRTAIAATSTAEIAAVRAQVREEARAFGTSIAATYAVPTRPPALATALAAPSPTPRRATLVVRGTGGSGLIVRRTPGGDRVASANEGQEVADLGDRQQNGGREWRRVRAPDGVEGWAIAEFLAPSGR